MVRSSRRSTPSSSEEVASKRLSKLPTCYYSMESSIHTQLSQCLNSPLLMLPYSQVDDNCRSFKCPFSDRCYRIHRPKFNRRYECLGSFHGWLVMVDMYSRDTIFLFNPFTDAQIDLPKWDRTKIIYKASLSSSPSDPNCIVMILDDSVLGLRFCRVGDDKWRTGGSDSTFLIDALFF